MAAQGLRAELRRVECFEYTHNTHTYTAIEGEAAPTSEIIARERILWAHKRLVLYYNFACLGFPARGCFTPN